jgi:hypothetical protein
VLLKGIDRRPVGHLIFKVAVVRIRKENGLFLPMNFPSPNDLLCRFPTPHVQALPDHPAMELALNGDGQLHDRCFRELNLHLSMTRRKVVSMGNVFPRYPRVIQLKSLNNLVGSCLSTVATTGCGFEVESESVKADIEWVA